MAEMSISEIVKNGQIAAEEEVVESTATQSTEPAVSDEEYDELRQLQAKQTLLNANGYQLVKFIAQAKAQVEEFVANGNAQIAQAEARQAEIDAELAETTTALQTRFGDITTKYGMTGVASVNIAETSPHFITPANVPNPNDAVPALA